MILIDAAPRMCLLVFSWANATKRRFSSFHPGFNFTLVVPMKVRGVFLLSTTPALCIQRTIAAW